MGSFSIWHWLIVLLVVVLIFGTKKLKNIGSDLGSGTATLNNTFLYNNTWGYDLYNSTLALSGAVSPSTTYWFTLQNAVVSSGNPVNWDENDGPSSANENVVGGIDSEAFTLYGVPEPQTYALAGGLGLIGFAGYRRLRRA